MTPDRVPISGSCDPNFDGVRAAFTNNFLRHGESGAALCVIFQGRVVADLWGGRVGGPESQAWTADTLVDVFSVGKAIAALAVARLWDDQDIDVLAPVAAYWPEFAKQGKSSLTVAHLMSHSAGLPAIRRQLPADAVFDHDFMCAALAGEEPWWKAGTAHGYHANTWGYLVAELVRRVDGRSLGTMVSEDITEANQIDVHIGLRGQEASRLVADIQYVGSELHDPGSFGSSPEQVMTYNAYFNPPGLSGVGIANSREWRQAEIPSANAHASARGVARLYETLLPESHSKKIVSEAAVLLFTSEHALGMDRILQRVTRFGLGFQLSHPDRPLGGPNSFGHFGAGGSLGFCDPSSGLAFGYATNSMGIRWQTRRNRSLIDAVYASLRPTD